MLTQCLNRTWSVILQQILHTSTRKLVRTESDLLLCDGKLQHKHAPAAKKVTQTRLKNLNSLSMTWYQLKIMWRMHMVAPLTSKVCKTCHATLNAIACMCQTICDATSSNNSSNSVILRNSYISLLSEENGISSMKPQLFNEQFEPPCETSKL